MPFTSAEVHRGSKRWRLQVAELTSWGTVAALALVVVGAGLPSGTYRWGLLLLALLGAWIFVTFRIVFVQAAEARWAAWSSLLAGLGFAAVAYSLLRFHVPSIALVFLPVIVIVGLLRGLREALATAGLATAGYWLAGDIVAGPPGLVSVALHAGAFALSGSIAGLLARELGSHYRGEQEEHRLATAVRHRLLAVLDAVDEGVIFRDRNGVVRVINRRAGEFFDLRADDHLGEPANELLRTIARLTEDPEGFMETFQELRDDPELELRSWIEQILPERRQFRLYSGPTFDEAGLLGGRIEVYTDVTEGVRRSAEIERLYEETRAVAESYQRSLLPTDAPSVPRINVVAHYVPAAGRRGVSGDFYDFMPLSEGKLGVTLGDVCGIGPAAVNDAALARYTLRSLAAEQDDPALLFERLNHQIVRQSSSERFTRLLLGALDPERAVLEYVNAGHVPPIVYRAGPQEVEWLAEGGIALGVEEDVQYKCARVELQPGDMILFYTDGVTDALRNGRPLGQGKLTDLVEEYGVGTPGELVQAIRRAVEAWVFGGEPRDDVALLAFQVAPDAAIAEPVRELVLPNEPARVAEVRAFVASFLADVRAPVEISQEYVLAVGEAAANAYRYGRRSMGRSEVRIQCRLEGPAVVTSITDEGRGFDPHTLEREGPPDRFASGGRGLFLMRALTDDVGYEVGEQGTTVTLRRRVFEHA